MLGNKEAKRSSVLRLKPQTGTHLLKSCQHNVHTSLLSSRETRDVFVLFYCSASEKIVALKEKVSVPIVFL